MISRAILVAALLVGTGATPRTLSGQRTLPDTLDGRAYHQLVGARVRVRFAVGDSLIATRVSALLESELPLPGLPDSVPRDVVAILPHGAAAFDLVTGGTVPEWRAGVAIPADNMLVVPTDEVGSLLQTEGRRVLRHEWAHLGLHQYLHGLRIPRWFDEGYAQWASGGWDAGEVWRLRILIALGKAPPLDSLSLGWPRDRASAQAAYLLSASAVSYLIGESGERGLELFLSRWRQGGSFELALRHTFGVTSGQFEEDWRRYVRKHYGWLFVLSHSAIFWMLLGLLLLFMMRMRSKRNRERMARLRAADVPDQPEFWVVEEDEEGPADGEGG